MAAAALSTVGLGIWAVGERHSTRIAEARELWQRGVIAWSSGVAAPDRPLEDIRRIEDIYTRALELDPTLADAYLDRARVRTQLYVSGVDVGETNAEAARADIAAARRLVGDTPRVLVRQGLLVALLDDDFAGAVELFERAEAQRPLGPDELMSKANVLLFAGRIEESDATSARAASLEPASLGVHDFWIRNLVAMRRFDRAMEVADSFDRRAPGVLQRGEAVLAFTGSTSRWRAETDIRTATDTPQRLSIEADLLRFEGRPQDALSLLETTTEPTFRQRHMLGYMPGATELPLAELRGWAHLLAGDATAAAQDGEQVRAFLQRQPPRHRHPWWPRLLAAEGALFRGDRAEAIAQARRVLEEVAPGHLVPLVHARSRVARIFAWAGEPEAAIDLLELLSGTQGGLGPAAITRDPLYALPLGTQPRYRALAQRLEGEIRANQQFMRPTAAGR